MNFDDIDSEYEYIVIGLGPVGALAALRLAQLLDEQNADSHKRILAVEAREEAIHCDPKRVYHAAHLVSHFIIYMFGYLLLCPILIKKEQTVTRRCCCS